MFPAGAGLPWAGGTAASGFRVRAASRATSFAGPSLQGRGVSWPQHPSPLTGVPVNSRVSSKIQQLLDTLKRPKRPPLTEFFVDDGEGLLEGGRPQRGPAGVGGVARRCRRGRHAPHGARRAGLRTHWGGCPGRGLWPACGPEVSAGRVAAGRPAVRRRPVSRALRPSWTAVGASSRTSEVSFYLH